MASSFSVHKKQSDSCHAKHTCKPQTTVKRTWLFKNRIPLTQTIRMRVGMSQLTESGHLLRSNRPLQTLFRGSLPLGHITQQWTPAVRPEPAPLCCSVVVFLPVTILMIMVFRSSLCFWVHFIFLADLCVCPWPSLRRVVAVFFSFMRESSEEKSEGSGLKKDYRFHMWTTAEKHAHTFCPLIKE